MSLQIVAQPSLCTTPAFDQKVKCNIARKSGHKYVSGNTFKERTGLNRLKDFTGASRGVSVMAKAHFESRQYVQAAMLRKDELASRKSEALGRPLTDEEYDALVWDSGGVQTRTNREDHIRYRSSFFDRAKGASKRNARARYISSIAHGLHGLCEMMAAPTGMTTTVVRNGVTQCTDDKSAKNKKFMFGLLAFVGVGTGMGVNNLKNWIGEGSLPFILGETILGALVAFPAISSAMGGLGTIIGGISQLVVERQHMGKGQKTDLQADLNTNMNQLLHLLKSMHNKPELIKVSAKAMQGLHIFGKVDSAHLDGDNVPMLLNQALAAIDLDKSDAENMLALRRAVGSYLQVDKPVDGSKWARYRYAKAVTKKESHFVALLSLIDHSETKKPSQDLTDARKKLENNLMPRFQRFTLRRLSHVVKPVDMVLRTSMSETLKRWGTRGYADIHSAKMADPSRAAQNCFKGEYMVKNMHQYHGATRKLTLLAETCRIFNMNIVLASNANLSRIFNNLALNSQRTIGTGPASRSMCHSVGRCLGGALLAILFGTVLPSFSNVEGATTQTTDAAGNVITNKADDTDAAIRPIDIGTNPPVTYSVANIGILMFIISVPTLLLMGAAQGAAHLQGWKGNVVKELPHNAKHYNW